MAVINFSIFNHLAVFRIKFATNFELRMLRNYTKEDIEKFRDHVLEKPDGYNYLYHKGYTELLATIDAIRGDEKAFAFLMKAKQYELAGFVNAIWEDSSAFKMLMDKQIFDWAAMANIINGDERAIDFLRKQRKEHYLGLALAIQKRIREDNDKNSNIFNFMRFMKK